VNDFAGRVATVSGAGRGLGGLCALDSARRESAVVVNDLRGSIRGSGAHISVADPVAAVCGRRGIGAMSDCIVDEADVSRFVQREDGADAWVFGGAEATSVGLDAVAGRQPAEYGAETLMAVE
jgi:NAD(P)-dependent dehydrogenase (short-subunit alcohol dehydrogenase family)